MSFTTLHYFAFLASYSTTPGLCYTIPQHFRSSRALSCYHIVQSGPCRLMYMAACGSWLSLAVFVYAAVSISAALCFFFRSLLRTLAGLCMAACLAFLVTDLDHFKLQLRCCIQCSLWASLQGFCSISLGIFLSRIFFLSRLASLRLR